VELVLSAPVTIRGRVVDKSTGAPITAFSLGMDIRPSDTERNFAQTFPPTEKQDPQGQFEIDQLPGGDVAVSVVAPGYAPAAVVVADLKDGEIREDVAIALESCGVVRGTVVDPAGNPVGDGKVTLKADDGSDVPPVSTTTNRDGQFSIDTVSLEYTSISITSESYANTSAAFNATSDRDIVISLQNGGSLTGYVTVNGEPLANAFAYAKESAEYGKSNENGIYRIDHVADGAYIVEVQMPFDGGITAPPALRFPITFRDNEEVTMNAAFEFGEAALAIQVDRSKFPNDVGIEVMQVNSLGQRQVKQPGAAADALRVEGLLPGTAQVTVTGSDKTVLHEADIVIVPGAANTISIP
jgi:hypothetical protein